PAYSATGMSGLPCAVFDGTDDLLTLAPVPASFPTTGAGEIWVSCRQDALAADGANRVAFGFGANSSTNQRNIRRSLVSGVSRARAIAAGQTATNTAVDFSGVHVARGRYGASMQMDVDGVASST